MDIFFCFKCDTPPRVDSPEDAVSHLVEEHGMDRQLAEEEIEELMEV